MKLILTIFIFIGLKFWELLIKPIYKLLKWTVLIPYKIYKWLFVKNHIPLGLAANLSLDKTKKYYNWYLLLFYLMLLILFCIFIIFAVGQVFAIAVGIIKIFFNLSLKEAYFKDITLTIVMLVYFIETILVVIWYTRHEISEFISNNWDKANKITRRK